MYSVFQHWDPLKVCLVGRTYPPEFYQWIADTGTRKRFEKLAEEIWYFLASFLKSSKAFYYMFIIIFCVL